jgi:hypothetical protein
MRRREEGTPAARGWYKATKTGTSPIIEGGIVGDGPGGVQGIDNGEDIPAPIVGKSGHAAQRIGGAKGFALVGIVKDVPHSVPSRIPSRPAFLREGPRKEDVSGRLNLSNRRNAKKLKNCACTLDREIAEGLESGKSVKPIFHSQPSPVGQE